MSRNTKASALREMISWGKSSNNIGYFYITLQDINIYVEDTAKGSEAIYKALISNIFPEKKVRDIISLGGRSEVIEACKIKKNNLKELYLIDGDLNLLYEPIMKINGLFNSSVYCIENYMVDETALSVVLEETLVLDPEAAKTNLAWCDFVLSMKNAFLEVFIIYAVSHSLESGEKTIKRFDPATWIDHSVKKGEYKRPNQAVIDSSISQLKNRLITTYGTEIFNEKINKINSLVASIEDEVILNFISGKNYLLPFLWNYLCSKGTPSGAIPLDSLKYRLIKNSKHKELQKLKLAIQDVALKGEYIPT